MKLSDPRLACPLLAVILIAAGCSGDTEGEGIRPTLTAAVARPEVRDLPRRVMASGPIEPWQEAIVGAELSGLRIERVHAEVGQVVRRGALLVELDAGTLKAQVLEAEATVAEARALQVEAAASAARGEALAQSGAISQRDLDQLKAAAGSADARVQRAEAQLAIGRERLSYARVLAPDDGVIASRTAVPGSMVTNGMELYRLVRQGRVEWRAEVPEGAFPQVAIGQLASVESRAGDRVEGRVRIVSPGLDPATRSGIAYVDLPVGGPLRAGMYANGWIEVGMTQAMLVPLSAVTSRDGSHYVFVLTDGDQVRETKVQVGATLERSVEVTAGLSKDALVVTSGAGFLRDGDRVTVVAPQ